MRKEEQFSVCHQPDASFNPGDDVPPDIPAQPLAFGCKRRLRKPRSTTQASDLRADDIAGRSDVACHSAAKLMAFLPEKRVIEHTIVKLFAFPFLSILAFAALPYRGWAIPPEEAAKHIGETATIEGRIVSVHTSRRGNVFLNFGAAYPHQVFSILLFAQSGSGVNAARFERKFVAATGSIQMYRGKPEMIIPDGSQLKILPERQ